MDIYKLKEMSEEDRKSVLESESVSIEEHVYTKPLSPEELAIKKDEFANTAMVQAAILDELAEVKAKYKERLEPLKENIKELLNAIRTKSTTQHGKVFRLADYENQMMHTVDPSGNVLSSRRMLPEERQFRIQSAKAI